MDVEEAKEMNHKFLESQVESDIPRSTPSRSKEQGCEITNSEVTLLIGHYMMTARFLETLDIDLDEEATLRGLKDTDSAAS